VVSTQSTVSTLEVSLKGTEYHALWYTTECEIMNALSVCAHVLCQNDVYILELRTNINLKISRENFERKKTSRDFLHLGLELIVYSVGCW